MAKLKDAYPFEPPNIMYFRKIILEEIVQNTNIAIAVLLYW